MSVRSGGRTLTGDASRPGLPGSPKRFAAAAFLRPISIEPGRVRCHRYGSDRQVISHDWVTFTTG